MKHLVIIGAGAFAREMYDNILESNGYGIEFEIKGNIVEKDYISEEDNALLQTPFLTSVEEYEIESDDMFICAIGSVAGRKSAVKKIKDKGGKFTTLIHKTALVSKNARIGEGVILGAFTGVGDRAVIHDYVMLNTHSVVGHDTIIGEYTCVMPYVCITGKCKIGEGVFLASGCMMNPGCKIGDGAFVGIGSVVLRRVRANTKVFGNPARVFDICEEI